MSHNKNNSRRHWQYSGYNQCHECLHHGFDGHHYDTWTSLRPSKLVLCKACYEFIYKHDRKQQPTPACPWFHQPSLFDNLGE